ncbi:MAG: hypothetical protein H7138_02630 [Myxococcales bacterium]|nr:hypothetical protein [Myxococcales bacterium]
MQSLCLMSVLALTAGCVGNDGAIEYQVEGGLSGRGDGSPAVRIEPDGTITRTPREGDPEVRVLSSSTMATLRARIAALEVRTLSDSYAKCCDFFEHVLTVELDRRMRTLTVSDNSGAPRELEDLIDLLHDLAVQ